MTDRPWAPPKLFSGTRGSRLKLSCDAGASANVGASQTLSMQPHPFLLIVAILSSCFSSVLAQLGQFVLRFLICHPS